MPVGVLDRCRVLRSAVFPVFSRVHKLRRGLRALGLGLVLLGVFPPCSCFGWFFLLLSVFFLFGRRPKDRSLPACDRGRRVPAPSCEGRRVKAGAPTQEPVSLGIPYPVSLMKYVLFIVYGSFWFAALFLHGLLLEVCASFTLLILEMLV